MTEAVPLPIAIRGLLERAGLLLDAAGLAAGATAIEDRLKDPLRVAVAGRAKAGKSTLINALVGERLAPTDAGECTKIVTWYRYGIQYEVTATLETGDSRPVPFERRRDQLVMDLAGYEPEEVVRLDVTWPSARLQRFTLIDTPGLESHDEVSSARTQALLGTADEDRSEVDAVVYLMRHVHRLDVEFLDAFIDRSLAHPSPVNAIAVLSRADEIGAGRPDALDSAAKIASRYAADHRIRSLCAAVVPVAGLIGETGRTLIEGEGASLRVLAEQADDETDAMVRSVDRFTDPARSPLDPDTRQALLVRLGIYGVRFGIDHLRERGATTSALAQDLVAASGVERLATLLDQHFGRSSELLKARSAIANLKLLIAELPPSPEMIELVGEIERMEAAAPELGELRLLHLVISGVAEFDEDELQEVDRLTAAERPEFRLGMPDGTQPEQLRALIVDRLDVWRHRAAHPLTPADRREACEHVVAVYERLHDELTTG